MQSPPEPFAARLAVGCLCQLDRPMRPLRLVPIILIGVILSLLTATARIAVRIRDPRRFDFGRVLTRFPVTQQ